ncbi:MAG TPA: sulfite exporter TauE/SafE family protein, partial [Mycobacterium sp.]|nr:sulfite exporter TauE/SafE family protein [Mycobacterium sp.]
CARRPGLRRRTVTAGQIVLLAGAGFLAGTVNAVAGGGSLISFPALLATHLGSVSANVTNTVALWPGYVGGAAGYRDVLSRDRRQVLVLCAISLFGAAGGSVLLLTTPSDVFSRLVPWLILGATALFAMQPVVARHVRPHERRGGAGSMIGLRAGVLLSGVYGAYFGAGLGIMLLGILGLVLTADLQRVNGVKNALSLAINTLALVIFAGFGPVRWSAVAIMATTSLLGGFAGSRVARLLPPRLLRAAVVIFGLVVGIKLLFW